MCINKALIWKQNEVSTPRNEVNLEIAEWSLMKLFSKNQSIQISNKKL